MLGDSLWQALPASTCVLYYFRGFRAGRSARRPHVLLRSANGRRETCHRRPDWRMQPLPSQRTRCHSVWRPAR